MFQLTAKAIRIFKNIQTIRFPPIPKTNISISKSSNVRQDGYEEENSQGDEFEHAKEILNFTVEANPQCRDSREQYPEYEIPRPDGNCCGRDPVLENHCCIIPVCKGNQRRSSIETWS